MKLTIESTDSAELICKARKGEKASRVWFWIPEEKTLRAFKQSTKDAIQGIATKQDVARILRADLQ